MSVQLAPDRTLDDVVRDLDRDAVGDLLDSVPPPTCEVHLGKTLDSPLCGKPAAWMTKASCGHAAYYCAGCHDHAKRQLDKRDARPMCPMHSPIVEITIEWIKL